MTVAPIRTRLLLRLGLPALLVTAGLPAALACAGDWTNSNTVPPLA